MDHDSLSCKTSRPSCTSLMRGFGVHLDHSTGCRREGVQARNVGIFRGINSIIAFTVTHLVE